MSMWTYVNGIITVKPLGRTQAEKRYILETVLAHLPVVTGSEGAMSTYIVQRENYNSSSSHNEFGECMNYYPNKFKTDDRDGWNRAQDVYFIVVDGALRDRYFNTTYKEFMNWLCRFAKRCLVTDVLVTVCDHYGQSQTINDGYKFHDMFEDTSWITNGNSINWCEYLMWERSKDTWRPAVLDYKYYKDEENDKRVEQWLGLH